ncbi:hypothetical protein LEP1GSC021_1976 [Leptospira noguchii str. 1993005606]|nr:hypothetical protein LEP1GSC021_1976 [Leptospira noguchii str. 1993005606]
MMVVKQRFYAKNLMGLWEPLKTSLLDFQLKIKRLEPDAIEVKNIKKMLNSHFLNIFRISKKNQA